MPPFPRIISHLLNQGLNNRFEIFHTILIKYFPLFLQSFSKVLENKVEGKFS